MALSPTRAKDFRKKRKPYLFQVSDELTILLKRVDMVGMILSGGIPMQLLNAADKFQEVRDQIDANTPPEEALKKLEDAGDGGEFREFLERYASYVALDPKVHFNDPKAKVFVPCPEDAIAAHEFTLMELLSIWNATPEDEAPTTEVSEPATFPVAERKPADNDAPHGESVREAPIVLVGPSDGLIYQ